MRLVDGLSLLFLNKVFASVQNLTEEREISERKFKTFDGFKMEEKSNLF
jgi:hypothetical protein